MAQNLGVAVPDWVPPKRPDGNVINGTNITLEPLSADTHAARLYTAFEGHDSVWDYMPYGPFTSSAQFYRHIQAMSGSSDPFAYAIWDKASKHYLGVQTFLRINPEAGSIELGHIALAPALQKTPAATEAFFRAMEWAFEAGYRRFEWKCNALNLASRRAAQRLGLSYEGVFRQAAVVKGRNRDTAWFAAIDREWPALRSAFEVWLNPANFDDEGQQIERLSDLTALVRTASDPAL